MRMMVAFEKGKALRAIGHLDLMRTIQRALRRSGLPIKYSNGFNPHIRLSFAAPLSVGVAGLRELMEVPVEDGVTEQAFLDAMNAVLPPCLRMLSARAVDDGFPTLMSLVAGSDYLIRLPKSENAAQAFVRFDAFMALPSYIADRRTKSGEAPCDIRPFVLEGSATQERDGYALRLRTAQTAAGALKPSLWLRCLFAFAQAEPPEDAEIYRERVLARNQQGVLIPLEAYGHE